MTPSTAAAGHHDHGTDRPAVVFDIDHSVFFITGRPRSQTAATIKDLTSAGYAAPQGGHLFLKPAVPPA